MTTTPWVGETRSSPLPDPEKSWHNTMALIDSPWSRLRKPPTIPTGFTAQARRRNFNSAGNPVYNGVWNGDFQIDETGTITGEVEGGYSVWLEGSPKIVPGF